MAISLRQMLLFRRVVSSRSALSGFFVRFVLVLDFPSTIHCTSVVKAIFLIYFFILFVISSGRLPSNGSRSCSNRRSFSFCTRTASLRESSRVEWRSTHRGRMVKP